MSKKSAADRKINRESCMSCKGCLGGSVLGEAVVKFLISLSFLRAVRQGRFLWSLAKLKADLWWWH